jgi:hypothetical protein
MTNDDLFIIERNIAQYQEMLKLDIDEMQRIIVKQLLAEAEDVLATDFQTTPEYQTVPITARSASLRR